MDRVEDLFQNILSIAIYDLIPSLSGNKAKNRLLDGSLHIQTIGEATKSIKFRCVSDINSRDQINDMEFSGQEVEVFFDDKYYIGIIDNTPYWQVQLFGEKDIRLFTSEIIVVVTQEGVI